MGNRGVLRAICRITANAEQLSRVRFKQIILAAPDVDVDVFRQLCGAYSIVSARTTLYVCAKDRAVEASGWLHQFPRVGLTPPICVVSGIDTVDVTNVDLTNLGHGYIAEARDVLRDIHDLITHGTAPNRRFGLSPKVTLSGERFWVVET
jgi:esterase/lipase superfamily enzyme